jgi:alkylation response protein AidB-like acyl-CoA dehydrogenase
VEFGLDSDQTAFADSVRGFARKHLAEGALARAHDPAYPWELAALLSQQGLLGIAFPVEDGGAGGSLMDAVIAIQELAMICPKSADIVQAGNFGAIRTFVEYASPAQKRASFRTFSREGRCWASA